MAIAWKRGTPEDDLSDEADGSLTDAGQMLAGGTAGPGEASTAPGSEPSAPLGSDEAAPHVDASRRSYRRIVRGTPPRW